MSATLYAKGLTVEVFDKVGPPPVTTPRYRNQQKYLFQTVRSATEPNRIPGGGPYPNEGNGSFPVGPNGKYVSPWSGWAWDQQDGDFLDKNGARNPTTPVPWFTVLANLAVGNTTPYTYTVDCTLIEQYIQQHDRWNAITLRPGVSTYRPIAGTFTATPPRINVIYTDTTTELLACRIVGTGGSSDYSQTTSASMAIPAFLEFERPAKAVQSATMTFTVTQHWSGGDQKIYGYIIDPAMNSDTVQLGIAATHPLDAGLSGESSIIGVHRYVDGAAFNDFAVPPAPPGIFPSSGGSYNTSSEDWFDPALWGRGPTNTTLLPHYGLGKWINTNVPVPPDPAGYRSTWELVPSTYTNPDGFKPLAKGVGAMRILMRGAQITDGAAEFSSAGYSTTSASIWLPPELWGIDELICRYHVRLGAPLGSPYRMPMDRRLQVVVSGNITWTECTGKFGIMPSHDNDYGGFSGSSGGGYGWQMRQSWMDVTQDDVGPDLGGIHLGLHTFDYNFKNPPGYNYGQSDKTKDTQFGQRGGLGGTMYAENWYCFESQIKMNSINPADPGYVNVTGTYGPWGFVPNGEIRQWIDGRLVLQRTGLVLRTAPIYNPGYVAGKMRPTKNLGHRNLLFNWFHGGKTMNTVDRSCYISGLAWGTKYIGPMAGI